MKCILDLFEMISRGKLLFLLRGYKLLLDEILGTFDNRVSSFFMNIPINIICKNFT